MTPHIIKIEDHDFEVFQAGNPNSKKLAIFLHGFPEIAQTWQNQIQPFADKGYKVWAPNLRGYGNSYSPLDVASYAPGTLVRDVATLIQSANCDHVTLLAHDWGGILAWYLALEDVATIDKLIILNAPHPYISAREFTKWRQIKKSWYMYAFQIPYLPEKFIARDLARPFIKGLMKAHTDQKTFTKKLRSHIQDNLLRPNGVKPLLNWYRALFRNRSYVVGLIKKRVHLKIPTLMIWGEKDIALGIHTTLGTHKHIDDLTLRYLKNAGHFVQHDAANQVNEIIHTWLEGKDVPGSQTPENPF